MGQLGVTIREPIAKSNLSRLLVWVAGNVDTRNYRDIIQRTSYERN